MQGKSKCRRCPATIKWVKTKAGKNMPCDPQPVTIVLGMVTKGPWVTIVTVDGETHQGSLPDGKTVGEEITGYQPHWGTCPQRSTFKTKVPKPADPQLGLFGGSE